MMRVRAVYCDSGWSGRDFGNKKKCYKSIGEHRVDEASQKCQDLGATVPIPRSAQEQADLIKTKNYFEIDRLGIDFDRNFCLFTLIWIPCE